MKKIVRNMVITLLILHAIIVQSVISMCVSRYVTDRHEIDYVIICIKK
ncbi:MULTISPECIES: hypothetical protein [Butyrivibrio]|nr:MULTISPECIES: hypothetical protein [Butyrivibrio]